MALINEVFFKFSTTKVLLSDNFAEYNNNVLSEICKQFDVKKTNITVYHPASNGQMERQNRKILNHLRSLVGNDYQAWH